MVLLLVAGCIRADLTECADGSLCPTGTVCASTASQRFCVTRDQFDVCSALDPFADCGAASRCYALNEGLVCLPGGCGNGLVDPEEQCDDQNNISADGCSADCASDETCGNRVVDVQRGEVCDDGDILSHDGCSSACAVEEPRLMNRDGFLDDSDRPDVAIAFDTRRGRMITFGGTRPGPQGRRIVMDETREWDGGWIRADPLRSPAARVDAMMAYDERRGVTVLFGGVAPNGTSLADTWLWTGAEWRTIDAFGPVGRARGAMAYDPLHDRVVMFGGAVSATSLSETWELRAGAWTPLTGPGPAAGVAPTMAYDRMTQKLVVITNGEHWELDGATWTRVGDAPMVDDASLVFETSSKRLLLFGLVEPMMRVWEWTGTAWAGLPDTPAVSELRCVAAATRGGVYVLQGPSMYLWNRTSMTSLDVGDPSPPSSRFGAAAANDLVRRSVVVFGGNGGTRDAPLATADTWAFDGVRWTQLVLAVRPSPRFDHAMAYDDARREIILFGGGSGATSVLADTWIWNGVAWSQANPTRSPPARAAHAMAYDVTRRRVVLFGGRSTSGLLADTWEWDGVNWTERVSVAAPSPRVSPSLGYDRDRRAMILFGGGDVFAGALVGSDETWQLEDSGWRRHHPVIAPAARGRASITWQPSRGRLLVVGGEAAAVIISSFDTAVFGDAWEWDGTVWRQVPLASIQPRSSHVAFMTPNGSAVDVLGGIATDPRPEFVELRWEGSGPYETCRTRLDADGDGRIGCADPDCWATCAPACGPHDSSCVPAQPWCGDAVCSAIEDAWICPADCGAVPLQCGDAVCDSTELCPGDC